MSPTSTVADRARSAAKHVLTRHPYLKTNRVFYELERQRAYRDVALRPELADRPDLVRELDEHGFVVVPDFLDLANVTSMLAAVERTLEEVRAGQHQEHHFALYPDAYFRIGGINLLAPETATYFADLTLNSVVHAYMSPRAVSHRRELDYRFGISEVAQADLYHFDNWRPIVKAFLYLVDVGPDNAPFVYVPGTHRQERWRRRHNIEYDGGKDGRFGYLLPQEMRSLQARYRWEDAVCMGAAGTLILADLRGLHRGTPLRAGRRVMLTNVWDLMNANGSGVR